MAGSVGASQSSAKRRASFDLSQLFTFDVSEWSGNEVHLSLIKKA